MTPALLSASSPTFAAFVPAADSALSMRPLAQAAALGTIASTTAA